jgi:hypothetical protein
MSDEAIRLRTLRMVIAVPAFSIPFVVAIWSPIAAVAIALSGNGRMLRTS